MPEYMPGYQSGDTLRRVPVDLPDGTPGSDPVNGKQVVESRYMMTYQAAAAANVVIKANKGFLAGITVGKDVAGGIIEISDHASDGNGNVLYYLEDPNVGYYPINADFAVGICADLTTQTNVMFHWR